VKVDDGKGGLASCAADIKVEEKPNHPPTATLSIERSPILPGERTGVTCNGSDPTTIRWPTATRPPWTGRGERFECAV